MTSEVNKRWLAWRLLDDDGNVAWVAVTQPKARALIDRQKVWTLLPDRGVFVAHWEATEDHQRGDGAKRVWHHDQIMLDELGDAACAVRLPTTEELQRITRPQRCLTLDQIDRIPVTRILGKTQARLIAERHR